jgi:hypothetical protein
MEIPLPAVIVVCELLDMATSICTGGALVDRRLEVASGFPYLAKLCPPPPQKARSAPPNARTEGSWSTETGSGIWLSLSGEALAPPNFKRGLGRWRLGVASDFPYLAKPLPPTNFMRPAPCAPAPWGFPDKPRRAVWEHSPRSVDGSLIAVAGLPYWENRSVTSEMPTRGPLVDETSERHLGYQIKRRY